MEDNSEMHCYGSALAHMVVLWFDTAYVKTSVYPCLKWSPKEKQVVLSSATLASLFKAIWLSCLSSIPISFHSQSNLLMVGLQLRPQQDACVISIFIRKEVLAAGVVYDWKGDILSYTSNTTVQ